MDVTIVFEPANPEHVALIPSFADIHIACIETDHTIATFTPPLKRDVIIDSWKERFRGIVEKLLVSPNFRRRGMARKLMEKLEELLDTETGSSAETVYPKLGYIQLGIVPKYGVSPVDKSLIAGTFFWKQL
ncbi:putative acetyltransferase [Mycena latifolia]|nr:putative acetyltransferase [Mycena latifolia]